MCYLTPVWEAVVSIPTPRSDHRKHQDSALVEELLIGAWIVHKHPIGYVGEVKFDWPAATCFEVCEQQPIFRPEQVAWVWFTMQELLRRSAGGNRLSEAS